MTTALLALTTMTASGCLPCQERALATAPSDAGSPHPGAAPVTPSTAPDASPASGWAGVIGVEGEMTGDGRLIQPNALRWSDLPLPLRYVPVDSGAHDGAVVVGWIRTIVRSPLGLIEATGDFDLESDYGLEALRQVGSNLTNGVSMDLDDVSFEVRVAAELLEDEGMMPMFLASDPNLPSDPNAPDADGRVKVASVKADDEVRVTTDGRVRAATIVAIPAFARAKIYALALAAAPPKAGAPAVKPAAPPAKPAMSMPGLMPEGGAPCSCDPKDPAYDPACVPNPAPAKAATAPPPPAMSQPGLMPDGTTACSCDEADPAFDPACVPAPAPKKPLTPQQKAPPPKNAPPIPPKKAAALVAAAVPMSPPSRWFANPGFTGPTPLTVDEDGRVRGHGALWGTCHLSHTAQGQCVTPPHSSSNYAYFRTGSVLTAEGTEVSVGRITLDTRHAGERLTPASTLAHYEDTGTAVADVSCGEDAYGIWVAGALRPSVTATQVRALRAAPLSGDWRRIANGLEMVALLSVNVPGFPVPRPAGLVAGGQVLSLVAAGMLAPSRVLAPGTPGALSLDDLRYLKKLAARERSADLAPAAAALSRRVHASALALRARRRAPDLVAFTAATTRS